MKRAASRGVQISMKCPSDAGRNFLSVGVGSQLHDVAASHAETAAQMGAMKVSSS